jgi:hypothetical protein
MLVDLYMLPYKRLVNLHRIRCAINESAREGKANRDNASRALLLKIPSMPSLGLQERVGGEQMHRQKARDHLKMFLSFIV